MLGHGLPDPGQLRCLCNVFHLYKESKDRIEVIAEQVGEAF